MIRNRYLTGVALALVLGTASLSAPAQTKKELAAKVIQLQKAELEAVGTSVANNTANQVMQSIGQVIQQVPADKREAVFKDTRGDVQKFFDEINPQLRNAAYSLAPAAMGPIYEEKFTEDELKVLVAWLESPVRRKVQEQSGEAQQALLQKLVNETKPQIEPKLKALEQTLKSKLAAAGVNGNGGNAAAKPSTPTKK